MAQIIKEITVDVARKNLFQAIVAKQNDSNSRFLKVTLVNEGEKIEIERSSGVTIKAERQDGKSNSYAGTVNDDGTVTVPLTAWMLQLDDIVRCDISVIDSESRKLTSTSFSIEVEAAANFTGDVSGDENYDILISLISECESAKEACNAAAAAADNINTKYGNAVSGIEATAAGLKVTHLNGESKEIPLSGGGSTGVDNTELVDIRTGHDGTVYSTAGDAVRGQISDLKNELETLKEQEGGSGGSSGLSGTFIAALQTILNSCVTTSDQSANITNLSKYIGSSGGSTEGGGDEPSVEITASYANGTLSIEGVKAISSASYADGILSLM